MVDDLVRHVEAVSFAVKAPTQEPNEPTVMDIKVQVVLSMESACFSRILT